MSNITELELKTPSNGLKQDPAELSYNNSIMPEGDGNDVHEMNENVPQVRHESKATNSTAGKRARQFSPARKHVSTAICSFPAP
jgi:hypothetical protein